MHPGRNLLTTYVGTVGEEDTVDEETGDEYMMDEEAYDDVTYEDAMAPIASEGAIADEGAMAPVAGMPCGRAGQPVCAGDQLDGAAPLPSLPVAAASCTRRLHRGEAWHVPFGRRASCVSVVKSSVCWKLQPIRCA